MLFDVHIEASNDLVGLKCLDYDGMRSVYQSKDQPASDKMKPIVNHGSCMLHLHCYPMEHWILVTNHLEIM